MAERKKNEAEISTRAFPLESPSKNTEFEEIVIVMINVERMNSQTATKKLNPVEQKDSWERRKHLCYEKTNQNIHNAVSAISSQVVSRKSQQLSSHRASNIRRRAGYHI